ncbi:iron chelate uptake ABC transporter family permease subunit [Clostridium sp. 'deep sea']|uniref:iron chelate uptake ABC transporter family permease subunit n=1 Tax=Clostridium sp. 'deep sea' TaxID=2779445 RepID=UPI001FAD4C66|nr:iron chelate uptake ABC transporter family permease subunit [Clostridium sp. 'deep sea']
MNNNKAKKTGTLLFVFLAFTVISFLLSVSLGAYHIPIKEILKAIMHNDNSLNSRIILNLRIPRSLVASLVGTSLALAGAILQGVMRNPWLLLILLEYLRGRALWPLFL